MVKLPLYLKLAQIMTGLLAFFYVLFIGQDIIVPMAFSVILAILLNPVVNFMHNKKLNRVLSIIFAILLMLLVFIGIIYFIASQVSRFTDALPALEAKVIALSEQASAWISKTFKVSNTKIHDWIATKKTDSLDQAGIVVGNTIINISGAVLSALLIPVYIFLFLFYKPLLLDFVSRLFPKDKHAAVADVLFSTKSLIQSYLLGLMLEMLIVATLDSAALLIIGVDYAIVFGVIAAILNLIPYVGGLIAVMIPMLMAFITGTPISALFVLIAFLIVQAIDNNFLVPMIVASKVQINALVSIIVVLIGGTLWGVAGMFLSIPLTAIVKVVFDRVQPLKPFGFLLGDSMPRIGEDIFRFQLLQRAASQIKKNKK